METIPISANGLAPHDLRDALTPFVGKPSELLRLDVRPEIGSRSAHMDTTVLVAIVSGASASLTVLLQGLLRLIESRRMRDGKIVIRGDNGTTVEVPAGTSPAELQQLAETARSLDHPVIRLEDSSDRR